MKTYRSHKVVQAAKVIKVECFEDGKTITVEGEEGLEIFFSKDALVHLPYPKVGMYYMKYVDGYQSFSPADVFELGYVEITL
ncbi:MAG: hypothetical protein ACRYGG_11845 [Janthinobacterium lividum]